jgi:hypothetical protein
LCSLLLCCGHAERTQTKKTRPLRQNGTLVETVNLTYPQEPRMTSIPKQTAMDLIQKLIDAVPELQKLRAGCDEFLRWKKDTETASLKLFPDDRHLNDFKGILFSDPGVMFAVAGPNTRSAPRDDQPFYLKGLSRAKVLLESIGAEIGRSTQTLGRLCKAQ